MATSRRRKQSAGRSSPWRSDALAGLLVVLAAFAVHLSSDLFRDLESRFYDFASTRSSRVPSERIAVIAIDDQSIANIGRWPWPREVHAGLIDQLALAQAKTVAHTAFFFEPQTDRGLASLRELREQLDGNAPPAQAFDDLGEASRSHLLGFIAAAEQQLDSDARLASSLARAGNVILPSLYSLGEPQGRPDQPLPTFALQSALAESSGAGLPAIRSQQPLAAIGAAARGVAHLNQLADSDGAVRREPLLVNFDGHVIPSMGLMVAAHSLNLGPQDLRLLPGEAVLLGRTRIETDASGTVLPQFYPDRDGRPAFTVDSFYDVASGKIPASKYAGKIVIIGATAAGVGAPFNTPVSTALSPAVILAHTTSSILNGHFIGQPVWSGAVVLAALLLVVAYLLALLPRLSAATGAWATAGLFALLLGVEYGLLSSAATWLPLVFPAALLLLGHLVLTTRRFLATEAGKAKTDEESAETNRMMGLALQGQGQLDLAFDRFRRVPHSRPLMDNLEQLALDFERKRQFHKVQSVYEHMASLDRSDAGVQSRLRRARSLSKTVVLAGASSHPGGTLLLGGAGVEQPMLGRYRIEKELGKGAMGVVYQGRDPKIGRTVAIKTLALSAEFEGAELADARERFFREAETAGRLQHPHIVTIFDAGEEHDLAFIAMEFLQGRDLVEHTRADRLLPLATVLDIGERVAMALDYAHRQNVVHRDIKPANIMYDPASDSVKVTDFGIARITDASRTKTGMVLGTPSFMSPEQLAGHHIDGRSDLYSLGVMLFQLLTGVLPLRGDSMAALMYQIANQPAPDVRSLRPDLPGALTDILGKALSKTPQDRYQSGRDLAQDLRQVDRTAAAGRVAPGGALTTGSGDRGFEKTRLQTARAMENGFATTVATQSVVQGGGSAEGGSDIRL
ncbi:CHASE2 domain-containing serine/threonine-protein kinase [Hydrogenophaga taeniospiralis]|uniref:CHASE2 domain-containing serine/threonine-protein kinase n=1 Tax=Hydrogenophaga taeniospiralis TaxID=65656 RepID=UPI000AEAFFED|nr:serine/threonine-protein kinase [Hydrogenophaga taeniospiralis]